MIKNVVTKMHGINVDQDISLSYNAPYINLTPTGSLMIASWGHHTPDSPYSLSSKTDAFNIAQNQVYMKRAYVTSSFTNQSSCGIYFQCLRLRVRNDIPNDFGTGTGQTLEGTTLVNMLEYNVNPNVADPILSITTANFFQKNFKILSNVVKYMIPGKMWKVKTQRNYPHRPLDNVQDANVTRSVFRKGNLITFWRIWGQHYYDSVEEQHVFSPYTVDSIDHSYYSWYALNDTVPTSTAATLYATTRPGPANEILLPQLTMGQIVSSQPVATPTTVFP